MRTLPLFVVLTACTTGAAAQPVATDQAPAPLPITHFEGFPPDAVAVPGLPGAMTHPDVPDGYVLIEGDIQVRRDEYQNRHANNAVFGIANYWGLTVPYSFGPNIDNARAQVAIDAMNAISAVSGLTFVRRLNNEPDWIVFTASTGNNSPVGRQGGPQAINLVNWNVIIICHEIYHSLGFWHEQSRLDRNTYVTIRFGNVCQTCCSGESCDHNFEIHSSADTYGPYDFDSFMHYPRWAFSSNGEDTITVNPPWDVQWQDAIGQRDHFSAMDEIACRGIYARSLDRWWEPSGVGGGTGHFLNPFHHSTFAAAYNAAPAGGVLFIKEDGNYPAVGTYSKAMTIQAPLGATLGN